MHIHILGIAGTFMGSLAQLAKQLGHTVSGCDHAVYPPMSTQLERAGIEIIEGFSEDQLQLKPDLFVVGNAISRGNPLLEAILNQGHRYTSGPQWLSEALLSKRWVLAVAGTHGKTTTTSMLAWILEYAGMEPGYLIGGVPENFESSARVGKSDFFVIEADEYDTAFFDKRSKFVHYHSRTVILNNLEFDHADIFTDLAAIQTQFHHLLRTVPSNGLVIAPKADKAIDEVIGRGCWTPIHRTGEGADWQYCSEQDGFSLSFDSADYRVSWDLLGHHNMLNAVHAIAAARHIGVPIEVSVQALSEFKGVKRRMECVGQVAEIKVYDDFAHHPSAIETTLKGLRAKVGDDHIVAVIEPRSNTMKLGVHKTALSYACEAANQVVWYQDERWDWQLRDFVGREDGSANVLSSYEAICDWICAQNYEGPCHIVVMSNGGFGGMPRKLLAGLETKYASR